MPPALAPTRVARVPVAATADAEYGLRTAAYGIHLRRCASSGRNNCPSTSHPWAARIQKARRKAPWPGLHPKGTVASVLSGPWLPSSVTLSHKQALTASVRHTDGRRERNPSTANVLPDHSSQLPLSNSDRCRNAATLSCHLGSPPLRQANCQFLDQLLERTGTQNMRANSVRREGADNTLAPPNGTGRG